MTMRKSTKFLFSALLVSSCLATQAQQLAFPEAQGWGRFAVGARDGGTVYHVTNLNDSGTGSLRDAISQPNRIIVFDVAGVINIKDRLVFKNNLYIAGQTAPGEGITVYGNGVSFSGSDNIIVRYMRFRMGHNGSSGKDAAGIANGQNMIFDHCSFSWGLDETFSINPDNKGVVPGYITISNSIMGQGLMPHSAGGLMQSDYISLYRNLYVDNATRNNKIKGKNQYVNNIVYNWKNGCYIMGGDSKGDSFANIEGNLFINGPANGGNAFSGGGGEGAFSFYGEDNWQDSNMDGKFDPAEVTNYAAGVRQTTRYDYPEMPKYPGNSLLTNLLPTVGASLPYRDYADCYMVDEVNSLGKSGELISNEENLVYGSPATWTVWGGNKKVDTDGDGMPDEWEKTHGTDPNKDDAMVIATNRYANIENYINGITVDDRDYFLRAPMCVEFVSATTTSIKLKWRDYTYAEDGFIVELKKAGEEAWKEVARVAANSTSCTIEGLEPGTAFLTRVRAFEGSDKFSEYSPELTMATRPVEAGMLDIDSYQPDLTWDNSATVWDYSAKSWNGGLASFTDNEKVLFDASKDVHVALDETVSPAALVAKGDGNVEISGAGAIAGETSVNKAGEGTLTLNTLNNYTGATVLHEGVLAFNTLKNGSEPSSIGASANFAQSWIFDGGTYRYTGETTATDKAAQIKRESTFEVENSAATVTMNGSFEGDGNIVFDGKGQVSVASSKFFGYKGTTILRGGTLNLSTIEVAKVGIGSSSKLIMEGGELKTNGEDNSFETYSFPIEVKEGTVSQFSPHRNCYIATPLTGSGTLQLNVPYLREYLKGDNFSAFAGRLVANGISSEKEGSLFLLNDNSVNFKNSVVELAGNARMGIWATKGNATIGGLSGASTTYLSGSSKKTKDFECIWNIGTANTDETFAGRINNWSMSGSSSKYQGTVNINKQGTGYWRLTGDNDYKGVTNVQGGNLIVNGTNSGTGAVNVMKDATLSGEGSIAGAVCVDAGATIQAGDFEKGANGAKLSLKSSLTVKSCGIVNVLLEGTSNNVIASDAVTLEDGAVIQMGDADVPMTFVDGEVFKVFSSGVTLGGTVKMIPEKPGEGQVWDLTSLSTEGIVKVATATGVGNISMQEIPAKVEYYDLSGRKISNVGDGAYLLRLTTKAGKVVTRKIMK